MVKKIKEKKVKHVVKTKAIKKGMHSLVTNRVV